jgi:hypothetical protein
MRLGSGKLKVWHSLNHCVALLPQTFALRENVAVRRGSLNLGIGARASGEMAVAPVSPPAERGPLDNEALRRFAAKVLDNEEIATTKTALTTRTTTRTPRRESPGSIRPGEFLVSCWTSCFINPVRQLPEIGLLPDHHLSSSRPFTNCRAPPERLHDSM